MPKKKRAATLVDQIKEAVVNPNSISNFFKYSYPFGRLFSLLKLLGRSYEKTVFILSTVGLKFLLIDCFWVWTTSCLRNIVTFVDNNLSTLFYPVLVRSPRS